MFHGEAERELSKWAPALCAIPSCSEDGVCVYVYPCTPQLVFAALLFLAAATLTPAQNPAPRRRWVEQLDAYGLTINEADFKANATVLAGVKQFGWQYVVIDEGGTWRTLGRQAESQKYLWDGNGILIPVPSRFPTAANGAGFKPLADWVHAQG